MKTFTLKVTFADNTTELWDYNETLYKGFLARFNSVVLKWRVIKIEIY